MMNLPPIVALEIGTSKVRAIVGEARENGCILVTGMGECPSRGVRKGEIVDFDNALSCVRAALQMAEENSRVNVGEVVLAVSGSHLQSMINRGFVPIQDPDGEITAEDIDHVMENARAISLSPDQEKLHTICQHFFVDDQEGVINPEGMEGSKLEAAMLILTGNRNRLRNVVRVVRSVGVEVRDVAFSGLCSALAVLSPEDKENGVAVIDLGGGTTDYVVYAQNMIATAGVLAVGGDHVTNDIAKGLRVPTLEAERLKEEVGSAIADLTARAQRVPLISETGAVRRSIKISDLNTIIHLRVEEIFMLLKQSFEEAQLLHSMGGGVVLTGGGAYLKNITQLAEKVFGLPCRLGQPRNVSGLAVATEGPEYATVVGLVRYGMKSVSRDRPLPPILDWLNRLLGK